MVERSLFWISLLLLLHSYVIYPLLLQLLARRKTNNGLVFMKDDQHLPVVSVIISVYNEEGSVAQRITNIFQSKYPKGKIELILGSDGSTDSTNAILMRLQNDYPDLKVSLFPERRGKGVVLNDIVGRAKGDVLILTDSKVLFSEDTVFHLVKHFKNDAIGIIGGNLITRQGSKDGISIQESMFMSREILMKYNEGKLWGSAMGAYGACYSVRKELFEKIPTGFAVEDFYITFKVLTKGYKVIMEPEAEGFEEVPNRIDEEFRRKVRISSGNFQNICAFANYLFRFSAVSFCFVSHKVIRWVGPLLLIILLVANAFLVHVSILYKISFVTQLILLIAPLIDFFLKKIHIHVIPLRFVTHFYSMNLALLLGFIKFLKGVKTNVWEPTKRSF